ncbi:MAG: hypothetical protein PHP45_01295 [Elusimicrobiales bacterium]|nr:hypothetical protein [Elusimicrobiales bacterium]
MSLKKVSAAGAVIAMLACCVFAAGGDAGPAEKEGIDPSSLKITLVSRERLSMAQAEKLFGVPSVRTDYRLASVSAVDASKISIVDIDSIINLGVKIVTFVTGKKPVVNSITPPPANALPKGIERWSELSGWQPPEAYTFRQTANDWMGRRTMDMQYQVIFRYGGTYKGKGKYLAGVTINPGEVFVGWGRVFNYEVRIPDQEIVNEGTPDDPIASMNVKLLWKLEYAFTYEECTTVFNIRGDGKIKKLTASVMHDAAPVTRD